MQENNPYSNCWEEREVGGSRSLHIFTQQGYVLLIDMFTGKKSGVFFSVHMAKSSGTASGTKLPIKPCSLFSSHNITNRNEWLLWQ